MITQYRIKSNINTFDAKMLIRFAQSGASETRSLEIDHTLTLDEVRELIGRELDIQVEKLFSMTLNSISIKRFKNPR